MKKLVFLLAIMMVGTFSTFAQRYACVDMDYILDKIPAYQKAQTDLDAVAAQWQTEIETKIQEVDAMYKTYQAEQVLMTEKMKQEKQDQIKNAEDEIKMLQKQRFGPNGDLFKKRQELIKPIQDDVYEAIQELADDKGYDMIFDKSSGATFLFVDEKLDKSDDVLELMGIN